MTSVLLQGALASLGQSANAPMGAGLDSLAVGFAAPSIRLPSQGLGAQSMPLDFESMLVEEDETVALPFLPDAVEVPREVRPQGAQPAADVWPTAALTLAPPSDGQGLTTSAPGSPDGPRVQIAWFPVDGEPAEAVTATPPDGVAAKPAVVGRGIDARA